MSMWKHTNIKNGTITIYDSKMNLHTLGPNHSVVIDVNRMSQGEGMLKVEEIEEKPKKRKKLMEED